jgi:endoglucanase
MYMFKLIKKYTEIPGPVGHEHHVQKAFIEDLKPFTEDTRLTNVGNVIAHLGGTGRKIVIFGHADEISWYVLSITENGFLRVSQNTGRNSKIAFPYSVAGQKALVLGDTDNVRGVFVGASGHILNTSEREKKLNSWDILVDIGASSIDEVREQGIHVGSPIIWNPITEKLGQKVFGKALDDRFSHALMIVLAERLQEKNLSFDVYFASTVMEEFGLKGAQALARNSFDLSIALDIGIAGDYPTIPEGRMPIKLGEGPVIVYKDGGIHYNLEIIHELRKTAEKNKIPYQHGIFENYSSDSVAMISGGTKPNLIAPPCRYTHTPNEMMHLEDLENTVKLLFHYLTE